MFDVLFLGTGASVPSRAKSLSCIAVKQGKTISLFDCGEGSQRQIMISPFSFMKVDRIFITHMHGDHMYGLPGLLQTMGMSDRKEPVSVFGPKGIAQSLDSLLNACDGDIEYELRVTELSDGDTVDFGDFTVTAFETHHNTPSIGYLYREADRPGAFDKKKAIELGLVPGKDFSMLQNGETVKGITPDQVIGPKRPGCSLVYTGDTVPCDEVRKASKDVDLLIHESTYIEADSKLAELHFHSTAKAAAEIAKECNVRMLALTHISNRYNDSEEPLNEAKAVFENTVTPVDMGLITVMPGEIRSA